MKLRKTIVSLFACIMAVAVAGVIYRDRRDDRGKLVSFLEVPVPMLQKDSKM